MLFIPLYWILFLLIIAFFVRKKNLTRIMWVLALAIAIIFTSPFLYDSYARWYQPEPAALQQNAHYSFGILAGGFGSVDSDGNGYFNSSSDRFLQAVKLYKTGMIDHILISGGNSKKNDEGFGEGRWARGEMIQFGVPDSVIFIEDHSKNTKENAINSKKMLDALGARPPYVLITSAFHMPRAAKNFRSAGMDIIAFPCNYTEGRGCFTAGDLIPRANLLLDWSKYVREGVASIVR